MRTCSKTVHFILVGGKRAGQNASKMDLEKSWVPGIASWVPDRTEEFQCSTFARRSLSEKWEMTFVEKARSDRELNSRLNATQRCTRSIPIISFPEVDVRAFVKSGRAALFSRTRAKKKMRATIVCHCQCVEPSSVRRSFSVIYEQPSSIEKRRVQQKKTRDNFILFSLRCLFL